MNLDKYRILTLTFCFLFFLSCSKGDHMKLSHSYQETISSVSETEWNALSNKKIYFGHQSVGFNIIDGVKDIMTENKQVDLNIEETNDPNEFSVPIFAHSRVGQNTEPSSKIEAFEQTIRQGVGKKADIAFFKFCYVDITEKTNIQKLFESYTQTMDRLQRQFPGTVFLYATVPLRTVNTTWKTWLKKRVGKDYIWEYADNIKRNEFNAMIRKEYEHTGKVFDIAQAESTYTDGKRKEFSFKGTDYASLVPAYTNDGGHLNELGRRQVAAQLLSLMIEVKQPKNI